MCTYILIVVLSYLTYSFVSRFKQSLTSIMMSKQQLKLDFKSLQMELLMDVKMKRTRTRRLYELILTYYYLSIILSQRNDHGLLFYWYYLIMSLIWYNFGLVNRLKQKKKKWRMKLNVYQQPIRTLQLKIKYHPQRSLRRMFCINYML